MPVSERCTCRPVIAPIDRAANHECPQHGYYAKCAEVERLREGIRAVGSAWRAGDDEAISNALAQLEDAAGLREQGA